MRAALWFLALFGIAVAVAVFAGNNDATVTLYWAPYRVDLSLNFVILAWFSALRLFMPLCARLRFCSLCLSRPNAGALCKKSGLSMPNFSTHSRIFWRGGIFARANRRCQR